MLLLLPKGERKYRGIGLVEVLYKKTLGLINHKIWAAVRLYDALNVFRARQVTGIAYLKAKLLQHLYRNEGGGPIKGISKPQKVLQCAVLGMVSGNYGGVWSRDADRLPYPQLLGGPFHSF